jgi:hypothetical protein
MLICAVLLVAGGAVSWLLIRNPERAGETAAERERAAVDHAATRHTRSVPAGWSCAGSEGCPGTSHTGGDDLPAGEAPAGR